MTGLGRLFAYAIQHLLMKHPQSQNWNKILCLWNWRP
jgi:hypothetical protein